MNDQELDALLQDPSGRQLELALELVERQRSGRFGLGCRSVRQLVAQYPHLNYSTVMRWMGAASLLHGPGDPRSSWGLSVLVELARIISKPAREDFLADHDPASLSSRRLRAAIRTFQAGRPVTIVSSAPAAVMQRTVDLALRRAGLEPGTVRIEPVPPNRGRHAVRVVTEVGDRSAAQALGVAGDVLGAVAEARAAWVPPGDRCSDQDHWSMPLEEVDRLPPGPLAATWAGPDVVQIARAGTPIVRIPVRRVRRGEMIKREGNRKTISRTAILNGIHMGCLRRATGFDRCDEPCFFEPGVSDGCFANDNEFCGAMRRQDPTHDVIHNGLVNANLHIHLPPDGDASLHRNRPRREVGQPPVYRVDAESADGSLGIALGMLQVWGERNPDMRFTTICSNAVWPDDAMLCWLASLRNVGPVGHTVSAWLSGEELEHRLAAARRFLEFGIPTTIWITTSATCGWDNEAVLRRALALVPREGIIEYPLRLLGKRHELPVLHANPAGACGDYREDDKGRGYRVVLGEKQGDGNRTAAVEPDGHDPQEPSGALHARCRRCRLLCGIPAICP